MLAVVSKQLYLTLTLKCVSSSTSKSKVNAASLTVSVVNNFPLISFSMT